MDYFSHYYVHKNHVKDQVDWLQDYKKYIILHLSSAKNKSTVVLLFKNCSLLLSEETLKNIQPIVSISLGAPALRGWKKAALALQNWLFQMTMEQDGHTENPPQKMLVLSHYVTAKLTFFLFQTAKNLNNVNNFGQTFRIYYRISTNQS